MRVRGLQRGENVKSSAEEGSHKVVEEVTEAKVSDVEATVTR